MKQPREMIRRRDLPKYIPLGHTQLDDLIANDPDFPKPIKLSDAGRAVAYFLDEIAAWQEKRAAAAKRRRS
jgi:predicted DNA-binding transcriptional regulator AlpA